MAALSDYLENKLIDTLLRAQVFAMPTAVHVGLLTAGPTDGTAGTEVTLGAYARVAITTSLTAFAGTQGAASTVASTGATGTTSNNAAVTFPAPTANWGSVTHFAVYDAATAGNMLFYGALGTAKTVNNGDPAPSFAAGALTFQLDN